MATGTFEVDGERYVVAATGVVLTVKNVVAARSMTLVPRAGWCEQYSHCGFTVLAPHLHTSGYATIVLVSHNTIRAACALLCGCEACSSEAEMPFDWLLDEVTGQNPSEVDYLLEAPAKCPWCYREIGEKTLIEW